MNPEPTMLPNGDVLAPATDPQTGEQRMVVVPVGHANHAGWVAHIQRAGGGARPSTAPDDRNAGVGAAALISVLIPFFGVLLAVNYLVRSQGSAAAACLLSAFLGGWIYMLIFGFVAL